MKLKPIRDFNGYIMGYIPRCIDDYNLSESPKDRIVYMLNLIVNSQAYGDSRRDKDHPLTDKELLEILHDELQALWNKLYQDEKEMTK